MSAISRLERAAGGAVFAPARRCLANTIASFATLVRPARRWPTPSWTLRPQQLAAALALFVFVLAMVLLDAAAINAVGRMPSSLIWFFQEITDFGKSGWFLWPLGILFLCLAGVQSTVLPRMSQRVLAAVMVRAGFLFVAIGAPGLFVTVVKRLIGRARPLVSGVLDPYLYQPFIWRVEYASLPSGHSTTAFSVLVAFGALWPRARPYLWAYAILIALSRVAVTAHYPSDVLAGAVFGGGGALLVRNYFASRRLAFTVIPAGTVAPLPGPSWRRLKAVGRAVTGR